MDGPFAISDSKNENQLTFREHNGPKKLNPNHIFEKFNEIERDKGPSLKQNPSELDPIQSLQSSVHQVSSKLKSGQK